MVCGDDEVTEESSFVDGELKYLYQKRRVKRLKRLSLCVKCGKQKDRKYASLCTLHAQKRREYQRKTRGFKAKEKGKAGRPILNEGETKK